MSTYRGRPLGVLGSYGALSFHETKNIVCGEGGALLVGDRRTLRAPRSCGKGHRSFAISARRNRQVHLIDVGSSYVPGEILAAFLYAQMEQADDITQRRWRSGTPTTAHFPISSDGKSCGPVVPATAVTTRTSTPAVRDHGERSRVLAELKQRGIGALFITFRCTLAAGRKFGRCGTSMAVRRT